MPVPVIKLMISSIVGIPQPVHPIIRQKENPFGSGLAGTGPTLIEISVNGNAMHEERPEPVWAGLSIAEDSLRSLRSSSVQSRDP